MIIGKIFGCLKVINKTNEYKNNKRGEKFRLYKCECIQCGNITYKIKSDLNAITKRNAMGCIVCRGRLNNYLYTKIGRLYLSDFYIDYIPNKKNKVVIFKCICDCGNIINKPMSKFTNNSQVLNSCGCLHKDILIKRNKQTATYNGESKGEYKRLFGIYRKMIYRCEDKNDDAYKYYGERGIKICKEWREDYFAFKKWALNNGYNNELTIDRIDVNGDYKPENCRWVDYYVQANNKTNNHYITYNNRTQTLAEWCRELNLDYFRTKARLNTCGMTVEQAFELPKQRLRRKVNKS